MRAGSMTENTNEEGVQRSSLDCGNINHSIRPSVLPAVSRRAGTDFSVGVIVHHWPHSDLPSGLLFKGMSAFHSPTSFPSFDSSSRCTKIEIVVTLKLIRFFGHIMLHTKKNCFRGVVMLIGEIFRNGPGGGCKLKQKKQITMFMLQEHPA